jgi:hypothetical protein
MQLSLVSLAPLFPPGSWAVPSRVKGCVVVFVPAVVVEGLGAALLAAGCRWRGSHRLPGGSAVLLACSALVAAELLSLPRPRSQGSRSITNQLPW